MPTSRTELDECLVRLGIDIDNVIAVVNSHLHFDHCGQNPLLHGHDTRFYSQASEIDAVNADPYYTVADWAIAPTSQQQVVRGDEQIAEGVSIIATPGHTAGHQSVLVEGDPDLERAAVDSMRRLKALEPEIIHLSHCDAYRPSTV